MRDSGSGLASSLGKQAYWKQWHLWGRYYLLLMNHRQGRGWEVRLWPGPARLLWRPWIRTDPAYWDFSVVKWLAPDEVHTLCRRIPDHIGRQLWGHQHALIQEINRLHGLRDAPGRASSLGAS